MRRASWQAWAFFGWALLVLGVSVWPFRIADGATLRDDVEAFFDFFLAEDTVRTIVARLVAFVPLGALARSWLVPGEALALRWRRWLRVLTPVIAVAAVVEVAQLFLSARHGRASDFVLSLGFALAGTAFGSRWRAPGLARGIAWTATSFVLAMVLVANSGNRPEGWDPSYPLLVGNEATGGLPWIGKVRGVAIYDRAQLPADSLMRYSIGGKLTAQFGPIRPTLGSIATYAFGSVTGNKVAPTFGPDAPPLWIDDVSRCEATEYAMRILRPTVLRSEGGVGGLCRSIERRGSFAVEIELVREGPGLDGPARIVSISRDPYHRNLTIGEDKGHLVVRIRTPRGGENGTRFETRTVAPVLESGELFHILVTYERARVRIFVDGKDVAVDRPPASHVVHLSGGEPVRLAWLVIIALSIAAFVAGILDPGSPGRDLFPTFVRLGGFVGFAGGLLMVLSRSSIDVASIAGSLTVPMLVFVSVGAMRRALSARTGST